MSRKVSILSAKTRAWKAIGAFIRSEEKHCCTCGAVGTEVGHFKHNGDKPNKNLGGNELWYFRKNLHLQCGRCNRWMSGNLAEYAVFLEEKYGAGILQEIQRLYNKPKKWTIPELLEIEELYKRKTVV